jgi:ABC-2 type transport system ATP-binding protein
VSARPDATSPLDRAGAPVRRDDPAIECHDLVVRYGDVVAVDRLTLSAHRGEVLALLGPNGAGKTSTVETLEGYRRPTAGSARVLGLDPVADHRRLVTSIGVMLQRGGVYPVLSPRRVLHLFSRYFDEPEDPDALLEVVGLGPVANTPWRRLSGGEQQRVSLALALVGRPDVLFLDEPTAGVDPQGRAAIRDVIAARRDRGACVVLTTHELGEAERLADTVVIVDHGRSVAAGTLQELATSGDTGTFRFGAPAGIDTAELAAALGLATSDVTEERRGDYRVTAPSTPELIAALTAWLAARDLSLVDLRAGRRTLEDVYLDVVDGPPALGHHIGARNAMGAGAEAVDEGGTRRWSRRRPR